MSIASRKKVGGAASRGGKINKKKRELNGLIGEMRNAENLEEEEE